MKNPWKKLSSRIAYQTKWMTIQEDKVIRPDGNEGLYSFVKTGNAVFVVAINDKDEVLLVGQYRYPTDSYSYEIIGGGSDGEDVLEAAKRELWEETGFKAQKWTAVGTIQELNGVTDGVCNIFIAQDLKQTDSDKMLEDGIDDCRWVKLTNIPKMIKEDKLFDSITITSLIKAMLFLGKEIR